MPISEYLQLSAFGIGLVFGLIGGGIVGVRGYLIYQADVARWRSAADQSMADVCRLARERNRYERMTQYLAGHMPDNGMCHDNKACPLQDIDLTYHPGSWDKCWKCWLAHAGWHIDGIYNRDAVAGEGNGA